MTWQKIKNFTKQVVVNFFQDGALEHSAAISFYIILSFPAFLLISVSVGGLIWEQTTIQAQIITYIQNITELEDTTFIQSILSQAVEFNVTLSAVISFFVLLITSSAVVLSLQKALNDIWGIVEKSENFLKDVITDRIVSFIVLLMLGLLFVANTLFEVLLGAGFLFIAEYLPFSNYLAAVINSGLGILLIFAIFSFIFKYLPDVKIVWRDVIVGVVITTILFIIGKKIISWYLAYNTLSNAYGAAGSVVVFLLWIYYSSLILFLGAEITETYANIYGSKIKPVENARYKDPEKNRKSLFKNFINLINSWHEN